MKASVVIEAIGRMCLRDGRRAQFEMRRFTYAAVCIMMTFVASVVGDVPASTPEAVAVRNPSQFQVAVRSGVKHIVINEHLDMTTTPRFSETTIMDAGMIAIVPNEKGEYTRTIRVRCHLRLHDVHLMPKPLRVMSGKWSLSASLLLPAGSVNRNP